MDTWSWYTLMPLAQSLAHTRKEAQQDPIKPDEADESKAASSLNLSASTGGRVLPRFGNLNQSFSDIISHIVSTPVLLVASDFDGTLAELVDHPDDAAPQKRAIDALKALSELPHTHVSIVSGRGLVDLERRLNADDTWRLSGSHGAEIGGESQPAIPLKIQEHLKNLTQQLVQVAQTHDGCIVEVKPRGVAFHYRTLPDNQAEEVMLHVTALAPLYPELTMRLGSMVVEFQAEPITKGDGIRRLRHLSGATAVIFIGDDLTDEHAFLALGPIDATVKVGQGDTRAKYRINNVADVGTLLEMLVTARAAWLASRKLIPITSYSVLSDQRTLALVTPEASVSWLCLPRIDSPPLFANLVGGSQAGSFDISPVDPEGPAEQSYDGDSMVLQTRWPGCTVTDYLDCGSGRAFQRAGRTDLIRVIEGSRPCRVRFSPRLDFGRVSTRLSMRDRGLEVEGSLDPILLYAPGVEWSIINDGPHHTAEALVDPSNGPIVLELRAGSANDHAHFHSEQHRRSATQRFWSLWAGTLKLPSVATEHVRRSAIILRSLIYGPTGAISAAATTSLPEHLGGQRNWDYRFCWPRDAAMSAAALVRLGNTGTAMRLLDWIARVLDQCDSPGRLRPIYTVEGRDLGPEAEISGLTGYGGSLPVRIGNAAAQQVQLDVFGPITDLIALLAEHGAPISPDHWRMTRAMVEAVDQRWMEPDHGIWEFRGERQHHVHSKAMCFHTVNRALVVHECVIGRTNQSWIELRERIREDVLARGFHPSAKSFTLAYGKEELDAATLAVGLTGLVDVKDPKFIATIDAMCKHLIVDGTVYRYRFDDGLPGVEGGFHVCTGWLIEALAKIGRIQEAQSLFDSLISCIGPTGILSEQYEPRLNLPLGNAPQAYSHLALINAAITLEKLITHDSLHAPQSTVANIRGNS